MIVDPDSIPADPEGRSTYVLPDGMLIMGGEDAGRLVAFMMQDGMLFRTIHEMPEEKRPRFLDNLADMLFVGGIYYAEHPGEWEDTVEDRAWADLRDRFLPSDAEDVEMHMLRRAGVQADDLDAAVTGALANGDRLVTWPEVRERAWQLNVDRAVLYRLTSADAE